MTHSKILVFLCVLSILAYSFAGCGGGGGSSSGTDGTGGGESEESIDSDVAAFWTGDSTFGAMMVNRDGEMLLSITQDDGSGNVTGVLGAMWIDASGIAVTVYIGPDNLPTEMILGDYILRFLNWDLDAGTVDIALVYAPTGYIEIFRDVDVDTSSAAFLANLNAAIASKLICFPTCDSDMQNLAQLLSITGAAISLGACGVAIPASLGAAAIPCAGLLISTASLVASDTEWLGNLQVASDVMLAGDALGCALLNVGDCITATIGVSSRMLGIIDEGRNNNSGVVNNADIFLQNPAVPSGVAEAGGGLPSCSGSYECTPGSYMPCYPSGVKQCFFNCEWGSCSAGGTCPDNVCETDAGEDNASCPQDCPSLDITGNWAGTYNESSTGDGGCTYNNGGNMSMNISSTVGPAFQGSSSITGIHLRWIPSCNHYGYANSNGSCSGSFTDTGLSGSCNYPVAETGGTIEFTWQATIAGDTMNGTFIGDDSGSFTLTR